MYMILLHVVDLFGTLPGPVINFVCFYRENIVSAIILVILK